MSQRYWMVRTSILFAMSALIGEPVRAQSTPPDSLLGSLLDLNAKVNVIVGLPPNANAGNASLLANLAALEASTAPQGSSSGGFTFTFNPTLGVWERSAHSFGPAFAERGLTIGKKKLSVGFNWLHASYDSGIGSDLKSGEFQTARNGVGSIINSAALKLNLASDTFVTFFDLGLTDRFDIGMSIPTIRVSLEAQLGLFDSAHVDLTAGSLRIPKTKATGLGDIAMRGKYRVWPGEEGGIAALVELRVPTGDTDELRGLGVTRTLFSGIWSRGGRVSPHVNAGYEFWSKSASIAPAGQAVAGEVVAKNQVKYAAGLEFDVNPRTTVLVDLVGRRLLKGGRAGYRTIPGAFGPGSSFEILTALPEGLNVISLAPGIKWNVHGKALLTASILLSLENDALRANTIPVIGFDWAF